MTLIRECDTEYTLRLRVPVEVKTEELAFAEVGQR